MAKIQNVFDVAARAMNAQITRLNAVASNLANARTYASSPEEAYKAINTVADNAIPDVKATDKFAAEIYEFYRAGILTGSDAKGTFHSASTIKRSEAAAILLRMFEASARVSIDLP